MTVEHGGKQFDVLAEDRLAGENYLEDGKTFRLDGCAERVRRPQAVRRSRAAVFPRDAEPQE
jgi:hypothetical protein